METILKSIVDRMIKDEEYNFMNFNPKKFKIKREYPVIPAERLLENGFFIIAEVKKGSPSRGIIRENFNPVSLALEYEKAGAGAVSVITERNFFFGNKSDLENIKKNVKIPVLRKDFIIHEFQIYEAFNLGADIVLLIAACLTPGQLLRLHQCAIRLGMATLVEAHNAKEVETILKTGCSILGINNRDLKTFEVNIETAFRLKTLIPDTIPVICESGIKTHNEIKRLKEREFAGALVGESLLRRKNAAAALEELLYGES